MGSEHETTMKPLACDDCKDVLDKEGYLCFICKNYLCKDCKTKEGHSGHRIVQTLGIFEGHGEFVTMLKEYYHLSDNQNGNRENSNVKPDPDLSLAIGNSLDNQEHSGACAQIDPMQLTEEEQINLAVKMSLQEDNGMDDEWKMPEEDFANMTLNEEDGGIDGAEMNPLELTEEDQMRLAIEMSMQDNDG